MRILNDSFFLLFTGQEDLSRTRFGSCSMGFNSIEGKEKGVLIFSVLLVTAVFSIAIYHYIFPEEQVWEATIFEVIKKEDHTILSSYGKGYIKLRTTEHDFEEGETYRIVYVSRNRNWADVVISVEKIS